MKYKGHAVIVGFLPVEVEADSATEAKAMIERDPHDFATGEVEAMRFDGWESEPTSEAPGN